MKDRDLGEMRRVWEKELAPERKMIQWRIDIAARGHGKVEAERLPIVQVSWFQPETLELVSFL
jgi:hypothetical protein